MQHTRGGVIRFRAALIIVVALALVTMQSMWLGRPGPLPAASTVHARESASPSTSAAADNDDDDDDDDDNDNDENGNADDDDDEDKDDDDNDNDDHTDAFGPLGAAPVFDLPVLSSQSSRTTRGEEIEVSLQNRRVVLKTFRTMPSGTTITLRLADPGSLPPIPGRRLGDLLFIVEASGPGGAGLAALPAEVNLSARYSDQDVAGVNEQDVALYYLDQSDRHWKPAPKPARDAGSNYVAATITALGYYLVQAPN